ncbi:Uma2 family endonuclease, partial [Candidatus Ozemobacteraceae bacterium]|nr:Uma2 family endonuclease [Candidatus Ozemobacteraceae bacterium]
ITKKQLYEKHGVKEFWIVSPTDRRIIVYALESTGRFGEAVIYSDIDIMGCMLFPGLEVDLGHVFSSVPRIVRESPRKYLV